MKSFYQTFNELSRRDFLLKASYSYLGVSLAPLAADNIPKTPTSFKGKAKNVIFLNMQGGMSHLDTFDLKQGKEEQGPVKAIKTNADGVQISEYLPQTAEVMSEVCVINSMQSKQGAHNQAAYLQHKCYNPTSTIVHPSLGSWILNLAGTTNKTLPGYVNIGNGSHLTGAGWMGAKFAPAIVPEASKGLPTSKRYKDVSENDFERRLKISDLINQKFHEDTGSIEAKNGEQLFQEAVNVMKSKDLTAFDLNQEPDALRDQYGRNSFGQGCLLARRLVESGVRFVEVSLGGWDTHFDNFTAVQGRCEVLDPAYSSLLKDLKKRGLLESTIVVLGTEFGRTPEIQKEYNYGRSHHPGAFSALLAGGGVNGGQVYGKSDDIGRSVIENPVSFQDLNATIAYSLGVDPYKVLYSPSKRPFRVAGPDANIGQHVESIFS